MIIFGKNISFTQLLLSSTNRFIMEKNGEIAFMNTQTDPRSVPVAFTVNKLAPGKNSFRLLRFSPASIVPLMLHILSPTTDAK
jgi:hypothetical protein